MTELERHLLTAFEQLESTYKGQLESLQTAQNDLKKMFTHLQRENSTLRTENMDLKSQAINLSAQISSLSAQIQQLARLYEQNRR